MRVINLDNIRSKQYEINVENYGECGCLICGRPMTARDIQKGYFLHLLPNGDVTDSRESLNIPDNEELGWWQVGCTCYKNFLKAAEEKPVKTWKVEQGY